MKAKITYSKSLDILGNRRSQSNREVVTAALNSWRQKLAYFSMFAVLPGILASQQQEARAEEADMSEPTVPGKNVIQNRSNGRQLSPEFLKRQSRYRLPHQPGNFDMVSTFTGTDDCPGEAIPNGVYTAAAPYTDSGDTTGANDTVKRVNSIYNYYWYYYSYDSAGPDHIYSFHLTAVGPDPQISIETTSGTYKPMIYVTEGVNEWNRGCSAGTGFTSNTMYTMADSRFGANSTALDLDYVPLHTPLYLFVDSRANDANGAGPYTIKFKDVVVGSVASPWPLNFALASNGGVVSASSEYPGFPASAANNGDRRGLNWANGGIWNDNSRNVYPDFLQIDLAGTKTIDEIDVIAVQDNYQNPTEPTLADIFTQYGVTSFEIQYWNGSTWVTVPGGSVTANNKVWTKVTFTPIETAKIRVLVNGALQGYSRLAEVEAWGLPPAPTPTPTPTPTPEPTETPTPTPDPTPIPDPPPPGPTNFALATNGGTVQSSSQYSDAYPAAAIINGDRRGLNWGNGGGWNDATINSYSDWVQVNFNSSKSISEIDVFTIQDNYPSPVEPTTADSFSVYGITSFEIQYWNGSGWVTVPDGVINTDKVWTKVSFDAVDTTSVRVLVNGSLAGYSRIVEVEAWGGFAEPTPSERLNVALPSNGGVATASSEYSGNYPITAVNNGDRVGVNWGNGGGWNDSSAGVYPDSAQVEFNSTKTIEEIDVFTIQDNFGSPSQPTEDMTFGQYGITAFDVQYWNGSDWLTVPGGSITANNKVWTKVTFTPVQTNKIRVVVNNSLAGYSRIVEVEAWTVGGPPPSGERTNFALASNGSIASASTEHDGYPASGANNGDRKGLNWGAGGGWNDNTAGVFPDFLQIDFNGSKTIDEVNVFAVQDNYSNPSEPTLADTFGQYGVTSFDIQYWNGSGWMTVPGGSVTGNNKVWTQVTFSAITTNKIRVQVNNSLASYSRLVEVEAWGTD